MHLRCGNGNAGFIPYENGKSPVVLLPNSIVCRRDVSRCLPVLVPGVFVGSEPQEDRHAVLKKQRMGDCFLCVVAAASQDSMVSLLLL